MKVSRQRVHYKYVGRIGPAFRGIWDNPTYIQGELSDQSTTFECSLDKHDSPQTYNVS